MTARWAMNKTRVDRGRLRHMTTPPVVTKACTGCTLELPLDMFYRNPRNKSGKTSRCKTCMDSNNRDAYHANRERRRTTMNAAHAARRLRVIEGYGGKCACCGETEPVFLCLDHVDGNGSHERRKTSNASIYARVIKLGFPPEYQILCANCNLAKERPEGCPHQRVSGGAGSPSDQSSTSCPTA